MNHQKMMPQIWFLDPWDVSCKMWFVFFWRLSFLGGGWMGKPTEFWDTPIIKQQLWNQTCYLLYRNNHHLKWTKNHTTTSTSEKNNNTLPKPKPSLPSLHIFQPKPTTHHLSSTSTTPSAPALACENCKRPCNFTMDIHIWSINSSRSDGDVCPTKKIPIQTPALVDLAQLLASIETIFFVYLPTVHFNIKKSTRNVGTDTNQVM